MILESTTYPGTTDEEIRPILEAGGMAAGRTSAGLFAGADRPRQPVLRAQEHAEGGRWPHTACADTAEAFYSRFIDTVVRTKGTREAETAKLLENTYRHINIALVNEMARFCHDLRIDLWDVIAAASTKPFGFQPFRPGPGVGGHCIPIDPNYLSHRVRARLGYPFRFVELAQEINAAMPRYIARRIQDQLNLDGKALRGSLIILLGVTYKPTSRIPASLRQFRWRRPCFSRVLCCGSTIHWSSSSRFRLGHLTCGRRRYVSGEADICVLLQNHRDYDVEAMTAVSRRFFDTRGVAQPADNVHLL